MSSTAAAPLTWPFPRWIAHRGAGKLAPENTLAAFRHGASFGYRAFECDVKLSADEVPFLLHDATLERTTNGMGTAGEQPWVSLSQLDAGQWHSSPYAGEPMPTMRAISAYVQQNRMALNLEIKPTPGQEYRTGQVVAQACANLWQGTRSPLLFSSFRPEALQGAKDSAPDIPRALLVDTLWLGWFQMAQRLGCVAVVSNHKLMGEALMQQLHGAGLCALCYTVNEEADAQRLLKLGIDGLITDAVDRFDPGRSPAVT